MPYPRKGRRSQVISRGQSFLNFLSNASRVVKTRPRKVLAILIALAVVTIPCLTFFGNFNDVALANSTAQTLPFSQAWTNTGLITTSDNWSGVAGIEGYFIRNDSSSTTAVDPRTLTGDTFAGAGAPELDVTANQANSTSATGGILEIHTSSQAAPANANPTIAFQGSATADAPFILLNLSTTGWTNVNVSYNLRDLDCSTDDAQQQVALQFRVGNSGSYTDVSAGYVADATARTNSVATDTANCTLVTPVNQILPAGANNQPLVQVRIMTTNAASNDEMVGVDDISVTATSSLNISDASLLETNAGTTTASFTVSLPTPAGPGGVTFDIATADGTAQDDNPVAEDDDYVAKSLTGQTIPEGSSSYTFDVVVNGDTDVEANETFFVNVTNITGVTAGDTQGQGTIQNDDSPPDLSINNVTQAETNGGTTTFTFDVSLSSPAGAGGVTFDINTADDTATAGSDYVAISGGAGSITSGNSATTVSVTVNGDTIFEPDETFFVNLTSVVGANVVDGQGLGTITNDEAQPALSINDVALSEGNAGTQLLTFTVTLSGTSQDTITVNYATADASATLADVDYLSAGNTLTFLSGDTSETFDVTVNGDTNAEGDEQFVVNLSGATGGATISDSQGLGIIFLDDALGIAAVDTPVSTNFDVMDLAGLSATTPAAWTRSESGTNANSSYQADNGFSNAGNTYSYGTTSSSDRALGGLQSGSLIPTFGSFFRNDTGITITTLVVSYTGEQWRIGNTAAARDDRLDFQYSLDATSLTTGSWTDVDSLDFTNPIKTAASAGQLDGNAAANRTAISNIITGLSIPAGATFWIRYNDLNASGADDGLAADDFSITANFAGAFLSINDVSQSEGNAGPANFTFTVSLTQPAGPGGVTFNIATQDSSATVGDSDYAAINLVGESIPEGDSTKQYVITVNGDVTVEPTEQFFVNVTNITGAVPADPQGVGTIIDDDTPISFISAAQGSGASSPVVGTSVTVRGIVTLLKSNGFFIQEEVSDYDSDTNTSEGIFVFTSSAPTVAVGDQATVGGTVVEFNGLTEITSPSVAVNSTGNSLPTAVTLDSTILDSTASPTQPQLEKYEGMRMTGSLKTVEPNNQFFEVFTVLQSVARPMREPGIPVSDPIPPDPSGPADCCIPIWDENPERLMVDTDGRAGSTGLKLTSNVALGTVTGPLDFAFGSYRVIPDAVLTPSANMSAVPLPTPTANEFTVAGFNIENFNNNATQRQKAALGIRDIMRLPDIIGVIEIFNLASLQALRDEVNTISPGAAYEAYLIPTPVSGITQNVGYLVNTARVSVDAGSPTQERTSDTYIDPATGNPDDTHDRPPLVLRAHVDPTGANLPVIVVVNHPRSFIDAGVVGSPGPTVRAKRKAQAESLAGLFQELQTNNPTTSVIAVGDYNSYQFNSGYDDSIAVMKGSPTADDQIVVDASLDVVNPNFSNLIENVPADQRYSFLFEGTPQALDHILANTVALSRHTRIAIAHMNSDFPGDPYASNAAIPERNSDHDAPVAYFSLNQAQAAGSVIISEFRFRGPGTVGGPPTALSQKIGKTGIKAPELIGPTNQSEDEFIEIYNNSNSDITVSTTDGSAGWAVVAADGVTRFIIPNNTVIPARGHFLGVNSDGYSLANYGGVGAAAGDSILLADGVTPASGYTQDIPDGSGIALFRSANSANFTLAERLEAAGYTGVDPLYREGTGFPTGGAETTGGLEYTFFRTMTRATGGLPKDTGDNTSDFFLADTAGTDFDPGAGTTQRLGAPGPENLFSPINRTAEFGFTLLDSNVSPDAAPNRDRNTSPVTNGAFGTLTLRRTFTNNTGQALSRLRFRIVEVTTFPSPTGSGLADLRALSSSDEPVTLSNSSVVLVRGTTLEQPPPVQSLGGGWNASLNVPSVGGPPALDAKLLYDTPTTGMILLGAPLNNGESINVQFKLGVMQTGRFVFYLNIEAGVGSILLLP